MSASKRQRAPELTMTSMHASSIGAGLLSVLALLGVARAAPPQSAATPAVWIPHAIIVDLDLPKRYSCDDLWYRFRAILLSIGARSDLKVVPYHCDGQSPKVQLQFSLPDPVQGAQTRFADLQAVHDTITLEPGRPAPLDAADCELMRQIKDELFTELPVRVVSSELSCAAAPASHKGFQVSLQALRAEPPSDSAAGAPAAGGAAQVSTSTPKQPP
jgi:hypothetical protein